jgi:hypothetical protein
VAQYLLSIFDQALIMYEQAIGMQTTVQVAQQLRVLEGRMTWLTYMVASFIGVKTVNDSRKNRDELIWDGRLSRCVFQLIQTADGRLNSALGMGICDSKLEIAILNYFKFFGKIYMCSIDSVDVFAVVVRDNSTNDKKNGSEKMLSVSILLSFLFHST